MLFFPLFYGVHAMAQWVNTGLTMLTLFYNFFTVMQASCIKESHMTLLWHLICLRMGFTSLVQVPKWRHSGCVSHHPIFDNHFYNPSFNQNVCHLSIILNVSPLSFSKWG